MFSRMDTGNKKLFDEFGFSLAEAYRLSLSFYKQKIGKAIHLSYEDNLKLIALKQQACKGPFDENTASELGVLDVIGKDRRIYWQQLGDMSKELAMENFLNIIARQCSLFKPYLEAVRYNKKGNLTKELKQMEKLETTQLVSNTSFLGEKCDSESNCTYKIQRRNLRDSLNLQTYNQFKRFAEKQFHGNTDQQALLIHQLQTEHYNQYMQQLNVFDNVNCQNNPLREGELSRICHCKEEEVLNESSNDYILMSPAKMWTRPDMETFKSEVSSGLENGVLLVSHGDTVTVRVPTNANGKCILWEFATDNYDIGFGIYFEWSKPKTNEVTVHVTESDDEDCIDEGNIEKYDLERGTLSNQHYLKSFSKYPISIVVPVYRRECHSEVYVGSHAYPGEGVYLLKFDNSFSIWRSKTLYYRVYYES